MKTFSNILWIPFFLGMGDAVTGILLLWDPVQTFSWMGLSDPGPSVFFVRFIGAFVCLVGLSYGPPYVRVWRGAGNEELLASFLRTTAWIRGGIAVFLSASVLAGAAEPAWWIVCVYDGGAASLQWVLGRRLSR